MIGKDPVVPILHLKNPCRVRSPELVKGSTRYRVGRSSSILDPGITKYCHQIGLVRHSQSPARNAHKLLQTDFIVREPYLSPESEIARSTKTTNNGSENSFFSPNWVLEHGYGLEALLPHSKARVPISHWD